MPTLYSAGLCPFCARARIVLAEKDVEFELVEVDLHERPDWLYEKDPAGRVPVLEEGGWVLPESLVIMEYLEERYPEPPLLPADPADRALARLVLHRSGELEGPYYALRRGAEGARERLDAELARLDSVLAERRWLGGAAYGLADIALVPWVLRLRPLLGVGLEPYPRLSAWLGRLLERPPVAAEAEIAAAL